MFSRFTVNDLSDSSVLDDCFRGTQGVVNRRCGAFGRVASAVDLGAGVMGRVGLRGMTAV